MVTTRSLRKCECGTPIKRGNKSGKCQDCNDSKRLKSDPDEEVIKLMCLEIRLGWTKTEEISRRVRLHGDRWVVPIVSVPKFSRLSSNE